MQNKTLFLIFYFVLTTSLFGNVVEEGIKQLSWSDRIAIRIFFDEAIKRDQAAHVLFFQNKPACLTGPVLKDKHKTFKDVLCLKGWRAFKRNEHLFPHPNFILSEKVYDGGSFKGLDIYIINKKSLEKCFNEHLDLFHTTTASNFTFEQFIAQLEQGCSLSSLINDDEMLLGILLGYGKESARAFKEVRKQCTKMFAPPPTDTYCRIDLKCPKACKISPVVFMGSPHSLEVQQLISTYENELEDAWTKYRQSKKPLKMILEKLCTE